jgi:hypothetical protein
VLGNAIVPKHHIAFMPLPANGEFRFGDMREQQREHGLTFAGGEL